MKLSKKAQVVLGVGIFVVLAGSLLMTYLQQGQEQSLLNQELDVAQLRLDKHPLDEFSFQIRELEWRLAQAESRMSATKDSLRQPESVNSIEATETLLQVIEAQGLEIIEISSPGLSSEDLEGSAYSVLVLTVVVEGDVPELVHFISVLSSKFPTGVLESIDIIDPAVAEGEAGSTEPSASLSLRIYSYEGGD
jgi:hypothetical protein